MSDTDLFSRYNFNPYQFTGPDWWMKDFHSRSVSYFAGCKKVLDLGAGRGFFLEALRAAGIQGLGVEAYVPSCEQARKKGLEYFCHDIFGFFESNEGKQQASTCDGVYCAHVVEHLEPEEVFRLFHSIVHCCAPGVRVRIITNNPADIDVLGHVFWADLTHKRLYPGELLAAMAKSQGFATATYRAFLGVKLGKRDRIRRLCDRLLWGKHKWLPNLLVDCA